MDLLLGTVVFVVLAVVVLAWIGGRETGRPPAPPARPTAPPARGTRPPYPASGTRPGRRARSGTDPADDAFVDGAIIGGALVWDHQRRRLEEREEELRALRHERDAGEERSLLAGSDEGDLDDQAEFDAMAGYGLEPWAVERYGPDPVDELEDGLAPDAFELEDEWDGFDDLDD